MAGRPDYSATNADASFDVVDWAYYTSPADCTPPVSKELRGSGIDIWLETPNSGQDDQRLIGGLKLIVGYQDSANTSPFTRAQWIALVKEPVLQLQISGIIANAVGATASLTSKNSNPLFVMKSAGQGPVLCTCLQYDMKTNATLGFIIASGNAKAEVNDLLTSIKKEVADSYHPLLVLVILIEGRVQALQSCIGNIKDTIRTGEIIKSHSLDFLQLHRRLAPTQLEYQEVKLGINFLIDQIRQLRLHSESDQSKEKYQDAMVNLDNRLVTLSSIMEHMESVDSLRKLLSDLYAVLSGTFIQERLKVESESKLEGGTDKIIVVFTVIFVPNTFVATLLTMPFFDWDPDAAHVVSDKIWVYFALAVPSTALIFGMMLLWINSRAKLRRDQWKFRHFPKGQQVSVHR